MPATGNVVGSVGKLVGRDAATVVAFVVAAILVVAGLVAARVVAG
jgi:hypothetical protein